MKNTLCTLCFLLLSFTLFGQGINPGALNFAQCPGEPLGFEAIIATGETKNCGYNWQITNGSFIGSRFAKNVQIELDDTAAEAVLSLQISGCPNDSDNVYDEVKIAIRSIKGETLGSITRSNFSRNDVIYGSTQQVTYSVPALEFPQRGVSDVNPLTADGYEWTISGGSWSIASTNGPSVTLNPDPCSQAMLSVKALNNCTNGDDSRTRNFDIKRYIPGIIKRDVPISVIECGNIGQYTFSVDPIENAIFNWSMTNGWSGSSTSNEITVTSTGNTSTTISVSATVCGQTTSTETFDVALDQFADNFNIYATGPDVICTSGSNVTLSGDLNSSHTVNWSVNTGAYPYIHSTSRSGTGTTAFIKALSGAGGPVTVTFTVSNDCGSSTKQESFNTWAGTIHPHTISLSSSTLCSGGDNYIEAFYPGKGDFSNVEWQVPAGWHIGYPDSPDKSVAYIIPNNFSGNVSVRATNSCGAGNWASFYMTVQSCGFSFMLSPNPATTYVDVVYREENPQSLANRNQHFTLSYEIGIYDKSGNRMRRMDFDKVKKANRIPLESLQPGEYYVKIRYKGKEFTKRLIKK